MCSHCRLRSPGRLHESHAEHEVIVRAIVSGNPARAHAAMLHHLGPPGAAFQESLSSGESLILKGLGP